MAKYTIETNGSTADSIDGNLGVVIEVCGRRVWVQTPLSLTPYTEPDTSEAYQRGYDDAKHECTDCQKIMTDAEQERVDKAYQQGLEDARNRKATCEFCEYAGNDESDEPCSTCCCGYLNRFRPKRLVPKADSRIRKKIEGIMESFDCTISDFEKAIEEIKNEAD